MKNLKLAVLLSFVVLTFAGCATTTQTADQSPRFRDARHANVILRFSSWDYTFMTKPFYAEDGFMQQVKRDNIGKVLNKFGVERGMAVVVIGWQYHDKELSELVSNWKNILGECGFHRVVILRATKNNQLNGSVIVEDASIPTTVAQASAS